MIGPIQSISVVVPAYNEDARLGGSLAAIERYLARHFSVYEVLVVDDGSTDGTAALVEEFSRTHPHTRLLQNGSNRGKGYSVRHGMLEAAQPWVLFTDADLSTPIEELEKLAELAFSVEVVIGSRGLPDSKILKRQPFYREMMGRGFNLLVQIAALPGLRDTQCGFKLFRREAARDIFGRVTIEGFGFDVESLWLARRLGYRIAEVPVIWVDDPSTKVRAVRDASRMAADLVRVRVRHSGLQRGQRPLGHRRQGEGAQDAPGVGEP